MRRDWTSTTGSGGEKLGASRVCSALLAGVLAMGHLALEVDAQGSGSGSPADLDCNSLGTWVAFDATQVPGECVWKWNLTGNKGYRHSCGPGSPAGCSSMTSALAATWATGMHIAALGHATNTLCSSDAQCVSSIMSSGSLFLMYKGPVSPPCDPRVRVEWRPTWNFAMYVDPPAAAVVAGNMSGEAQYTKVQVRAMDGAALNSLAMPLPVQVGPISIPVTFAGKEGYFVRQVSDSKSGDAAAEIEVVDWRGGINVEVRSEISTLNWSSESELRVCHSNPDLTIYAYCSRCSGGAWIAYREQQ